MSRKPEAFAKVWCPLRGTFIGLGSPSQWVGASLGRDASKVSVGPETERWSHNFWEVDTNSEPLPFLGRGSLAYRWSLSG